MRNGRVAARVMGGGRAHRRRHRCVRRQRGGHVRAHRRGQQWHRVRQHARHNDVAGQVRIFVEVAVGRRQWQQVRMMCVMVLGMMGRMHDRCEWHRLRMVKVRHDRVEARRVAGAERVLRIGRHT